MADPKFLVQFLPNDPGRNEALTWQVLHNAWYGHVDGLGTVATLIGYTIVSQVPESEGRRFRWLGGVGLYSVIHQSDERRLAHQLSFLCEDPMFLSD